MEQALKLVGGSMIVYFVTAACAATEHAADQRAGGTSNGGSTSSGPTSDGATGGDDDDDAPSVLNPVPDALAEDGSRLRARFYRGTDGSKQWAGSWRDSTRDEDCEFRRAADGKVRCLPTTSGNYSSYFANSTCTDPLYLVQGSCSDPPIRYFAHTPFAGCNYPDLVKSGGEYTEEQVYYGSPGDCSARAHPYRDHAFYRLHRGAGVVSPTEFVEATLE